MASWVDFAKKHNPNPKTKAQERESNHGGKLADDHFQRIFLGGATKRATVTSTVTASTTVGSNIVYGTGVATVRTTTSDAIDSTPYATSATGQTVYNSRGIVYPVGSVVEVVDTGRYYIILDRLSDNGSIAARNSTRTATAGTTNFSVTAASLYGGFIEATPTNACNYNLPSAASLVAGFTGGLSAGDVIRCVISNLSGFNITLVSGSAHALQGASTLATLQVRELIFHIANASSGTEDYYVYCLT